MPTPCTIQIGPNEGQEVCDFVMMEDVDNWADDLNTDGHGECFVGLGDPDPATGTPECFGCDVRCSVCPDDPTSLNLQAGGSDIAGIRFLRGRLAPPGVYVPNRNALGQLMDLRTNEAQLVPPVIHYERGSCHRQTEYRECFGYHVCSCWDTPTSITEEGARCGMVAGASTAFNNPMHGEWPDGNFFFLNGWPSKIQCRKFLDPRDLPVEVASIRHQTVFLGSSPLGELVAPCPANNLVECAARVPNSTCPDICNGWRESDDPNEGRPSFYLSPTDPGHGKFDTVWFRAANVQIDKADAETAGEKETRRIKNAALDKVFQEGFTFPGPGSGGTNFKQLDHRHPIGGTNSKLGHYSRFWGAQDDQDIPLELLPIVDFDLSLTRTRFGSVEIDSVKIKPGCPVNATIVIYKVEADMWLHLEHTKHFPPGGDKWLHFTRPSANIEIGIWLAVRVSLPPVGDVRDRCAVNGIPVEVANATVLGNMPTATPEGNRIRFANDDAAFIRIPQKVEWKGWLGLKSPHTEPKREYTTEFLSQFNHCDAVWRALGEFEVRGLPTHLSSSPKPRDSMRIYGGSVKLEFTAQ